MTTAPLSEVGIANMAASLLSEYPITSMTDDSPLGRFVAREFGYTRDELLQLYPWHFAKTRALLTPTTAPAFGWTYAYNIPADCIRLLPLRTNGELNGDPVPYELESRQVLTNGDGSGTSLKIHYIKREVNVQKFSPLFARALGSRLAVLAAVRITGKKAYFEDALRSYSIALEEAKLADSLERGTVESQYGHDVLAVRSAY